MDPEPGIVPEPGIEPEPGILPEPGIEPAPGILPEPGIEPDPGIPLPEDAPGMLPPALLPPPGMEPPITSGKPIPLVPTWKVGPLPLWPLPCPEVPP